MAEMRSIVTGAGVRMGRTPVKAIVDIKGFALVGALEDARSPLISWDAGTLAGTPENGVKLSGDAAALIAKADGIEDEAYRVSHPVEGGDASLSIRLDTPTLLELASADYLQVKGRPAFNRSRLRLDAHVQVLTALVRHRLSRGAIEGRSGDGRRRRGYPTAGLQFC